MNRIWNQSRPPRSAWVVIGALLACQQAAAALSEPHAVFYGRVVAEDNLLLDSDSQYTISARLNGTVLDSYVMGSNSSSGLAHHYVLRVPMDSVGTRAANHARTGDQLQFFASSLTGDELLATATAGERGQITQLKLGMVDTDNDNIDDEIDNCRNFTNQNQANSDNDSAGDVCDDYPQNPQETTDSDNDGMGDNFETTHGFNPLNPADASQDADQDGISNLAEFNAGSNPRNVITSQPAQEDVPLPAWALVLLTLILGRLGLRAQKITYARNHP